MKYVIVYSEPFYYLYDNQFNKLIKKSYFESELLKIKSELESEGNER